MHRFKFKIRAHAVVFGQKLEGNVTPAMHSSPEDCNTGGHLYDGLQTSSCCRLGRAAWYVNNVFRLQYWVRCLVGEYLSKRKRYLPLLICGRANEPRLV